MLKRGGWNRRGLCIFSLAGRISSLQRILFTDRLQAFANLNQRELKALEDLVGEPQTLSDRKIIRKHGDKVDGLYALEDGWVTSNYDLKDGTRQIVKVHLPGDILGAPSLSLKAAVETLASVTPVTFRVFPLSSLTVIFRDYPRIAAALFLCAQQERVSLQEHLSIVGRRRAVGRLAALMLSLGERLGALSNGSTGSFELPLVQPELAELLGITAVHLNRAFRDLTERGLVQRHGRELVLSDVAGLKKLSGLRVQEWASMPGWVEALTPTESI